MTSVKICGVPFQVTRVSDGSAVDHDGDRAMRLWGQISYSEHSIRFKASNPEEELRCIMHEILHGIVEKGHIDELKDKKGEHLEGPIEQLSIWISESLESLGVTSLLLAPVEDEGVHS